MQHKKSHLQNRTTSPIKKKKEVAENPDMHIDQDFPGYPYGQSRDEIIKPELKVEKKTAGINSKK